MREPVSSLFPPAVGGAGGCLAGCKLGATLNGTFMPGRGCKRMGTETALPVRPPLLVVLVLLAVVAVAAAAEGAFRSTSRLTAPKAPISESRMMEPYGTPGVKLDGCVMTTEPPPPLAKA